MGALNPQAGSMMRSGSNGTTFDGIICMGGEDWWYHNRGHFDFQIMRRLAKRWPVLFVNSIGVRMPDMGDKKVFTQRITRKLKSLSRGAVRVESNFWVYSPVVLPGGVRSRARSSAVSIVSCVGGWLPFCLFFFFYRLASAIVYYTNLSSPQSSWPVYLFDRGIANLLPGSSAPASFWEAVPFYVILFLFI